MTRVIASVFCIAALASCAKEAATSQEDGSETITPTAGMSVSAASVSRADLPAGPVAGPAFPNSTQNLFAVTAYQGSATPTSYNNTYFDNKAVESDGEGLLRFTDPQYYPADKGKLFFYAYSPVATGYEAGSGSTKPVVKWIFTGQEDIMYAEDVTGIGKAEAGAQQQQPDFTFSHLLKQVRFKLVKGAGFGDNIPATQISITNTRTQASLDLITGALSFSGDAKPLSITGEYYIQGPNEAQPIDKCLMCEPGTQLDIEIIAQDNLYKTSLTLASQTAGVTAGAAGVSHLVTLTFIGTLIQPEATIEPWIDAGETSGEIK